MRRRRVRYATMAILTLGLTFVLDPSRAAAQSTSVDHIAAETLFTDARALMREGRYAEACPMLADSQRLNAGIGTLLNLALCYRQIGKTASAWLTYREAAAAASSAGQWQRATYARKQAAELEPRLSKLVLEISSEVRKSNLEIRLDGQIVPDGAWTSWIPLDPGEHVLQVVAPGKQPRSTTIVSGQQSPLHVRIEPLMDMPKPSAPQNLVVPRLKAGPAATKFDRLSPRRSDAATDGDSALILGLGAVGLSGLGLSSGFGLLAAAQYSDSNRYCAGNDVCSEPGIAARDNALEHARFATIAFTVGIAALIGAGVLWIRQSGDAPGVDRPIGAELPPALQPRQAP